MTRVLIIKTSSMGDIVHNLPVIADIRRERPAFVIDWVVEEAYVELVRMTRGVTRVIPIALRRWRRQRGDADARVERREFLAQLRAEKYDVVLDTQGLLKSALIARRARLNPHGVRVGFSFALARERVARVFYDRGHGVDPRLHAIERMRALAAATFGYAGQDLGLPRFEIDVPLAHFDWLPRIGAQELASDSAPVNGNARVAMPYAVLLHATARPEKTWPSERWVALIDLLCAAGIVPVLPSGSAGERAAAEVLVHQAEVLMKRGSMRAIVAPAISLVEAAALLAGARVVVGVDTGLLHLAAALDAPTVGLFGATPRWRYAPYWSPHAINLGSYGELGTQPAVSAVAEALERLKVLDAGTSVAMLEKEAAVFHIARPRGRRAI
ncbi:MAG: lipopolysaccharide heptosyltransferase I [Burkholderiaceae bacterium]